MRAPCSALPMADVRATIAICTRNRASILARSLDSLCAMRVPAGASWEVVVVDNRSTDETQAVVARFGARLPVGVVVAPRAGLSAARNRAVAEARGNYILWTDDDAVVDADWLAGYLEAFAAWPDAALFGGPIDVAFDAPVPDWFARILPRVKALYAYRDLGAEPIALLPREEMLPFGTNYAIRAAEQRRYLYDESLGRHPQHPQRGSEETEVMLTMLESGLVGRWVPGARVTHLKGTDVATTAFIAAHSAAYGAYRVGRFPPAGVRVAGAPLHAWWRAARWAARYALSRRFSPPEVWIEDLIETSEASGALKWLRARQG